MGHAESAERLHVEVVFSPTARTVRTVAVELASGSTLADAIRASGLLEVPGDLPEGWACGIWGRRQPLSTLLRDGDRVELYRALTVDPKEARRLRYKGQPKRKRPTAAGRS